MQLDKDSAAPSATSAALVAAVAALLAFSIFKKYSSSKRKIPSVGSYPLVGSHYHLKEPWFLDLYERFGQSPIVSVKFGLRTVYVLNRWELYKEAMVDNADKLAGRLSQVLYAQMSGDIGGIITASGELWREYRRFSLKALRDFGFGRRGGEELISVEAEHLCRTIDAAAGPPIATDVLFSTASSNVICQLVFGSRLASEDKNFAEILRWFHNIVQSSESRVANSISVSVTYFAEMLPLLAPVVTLPAKQNKGFNDYKRLFNFCLELAEKREAEIENIDTPRDYLEAHLQHQKSNPEVFNKKRLAMAVTEMFLAGTDTTASTMTWAMVFMMAHPEVADKVHSEICQLIGRDRLPTMRDKAELHYTQAVIEEVLRRSSLVPLGLMHRVTESVTIGEYQLDKDDLCMFNVFGMHHDPCHFPQPMQFKPERHLRNGQFVSCEHLCAFGLGRRACLGESLARMELFILFSTLMQRYKVVLDPDDKRTMWDLTDNPEFSKGALTRVAPNVKVVFTPR